MENTGVSPNSGGFGCKMCVNHVFKSFQGLETSITPDELEGVVFI